jgi:hypothetical protein
MLSIETAMLVCYFVLTRRKTFANLQLGGGSLVEADWYKAGYVSSLQLRLAIGYKLQILFRIRRLGTVLHF